jgi:hypothetical protein
MRRARRGLLVLVAAAAATGAIVATATGDGVQVGGTVASEIALALPAPSAFAKLAAHGQYQLTIAARVTSTVDATRVSIADGDAPTGAAHGHLRNGAGVVAAPLAVGIAGQGLTSLAAPIDPELKSWSGTLAQAPASIVVRQQLQRGSIAARALHKIVLVTISTNAP